MKLNNKGFAISVILYSIIILIIGILYLLLSILNARHNITKQTNEEIVDYINKQGVNTITEERSSKIATKKVFNTGELSNIAQTKNYYYTGNEPNNYVKFNNELWRIIGIFSIDNIKHLKLVRNESIKSDIANNYSIVNSNIFEYLNSDYYNSISNKNMIFSTYFFNSEYLPDVTPLEAYNEENKIINNSSKYNVGLINCSDFGFAASPSYYGNKLSNYSSSINDNWLSLTNNYFTLNYYNENINIISNGNVVNSTSYEADIYPCIYLKKDVLIVSGNGEIDDPYILAF